VKTFIFANNELLTGDGSKTHYKLASRHGLCTSVTIRDHYLCGRTGTIHGVQYCSFWYKKDAEYLEVIDKLLRENLINQYTILVGPDHDNVTVRDFLSNHKLKQNGTIEYWESLRKLHILCGEAKQGLMKALGIDSFRKNKRSFKQSCLEMGMYYTVGD
jgi:hypothetical protein